MYRISTEATTISRKYWDIYDELRRKSDGRIITDDMIQMEMKNRHGKTQSNESDRLKGGYHGRL